MIIYLSISVSYFLGNLLLKYLGKSYITRTQAKLYLISHMFLFLVKLALYNVQLMRCATRIVSFTEARNGLKSVPCSLAC